VRTIKHPLSGATYDLTEDGAVRVVTRDGAEGFFDRHGRWLRGDVRQADPHLCLWIGGKELPNRFQQAADALKSDTATSPSTIPAEELTQ
jgi:hypothetical protein